MEVPSRVGRNIRRLRVAQCFTQEKLAAEAGLEPRHISSLENGKGNPTIKVLERIADVLLVDIAELFAKPASKQMPPNLRAGRKPWRIVRRRLAADR